MNLAPAYSTGCPHDGLSWFERSQALKAAETQNLLNYQKIEYSSDSEEEKAVLANFSDPRAVASYRTVCVFESKACQNLFINQWSIIR